MREKIHPDYHFAIFEDTSCGFKFLSKTTKTSKEQAAWEDGNTYPVIKVATSSESHPFYTGKNKFVGETGRVDKFKKKYGIK